MIELTQTLLPNLPDCLRWVYGVFYILEGLLFFGMLISPLYMIFGIRKRKHK